MLGAATYRAGYIPAKKDEIMYRNSLLRISLADHMRALIPGEFIGQVGK